MDQHPVAVDVADLEVADLGGPEAGTVGNAECGAILQARPGCRHQDVGHLLDAEDYRQFARLGAELHIALHLLPSAGHAEKEPQRHDPQVERRWRDPGVGHVELISAQILRCRRVW